MSNTIRSFLIAALSQREFPQLAEQQFAEHFDKLIVPLVEMADHEGVLLLLEYQLQSHPQRSELPDDWMQKLQAACQPALFDQLAMLAEQRKVFDALQTASIDYIVLKGGALAHWLYAKPHLRVVTDLDILLPDKAAVMHLQSVLPAIGYHALVAAGELVSYQHPYQKAGGPYANYTVDAHWRLFNGALLHDRFDYQELQIQSVVLESLAGINVLSAVHALFNACGHQALNLPFTQIQGLQNAYCLRWLFDIHLLIEILTAKQWQQVLVLAKDKKMSAVICHSLNKTQAVFASKIPSNVLEELSNNAITEKQSMAWFNWWPRYQWHLFFASSPNWQGRFSWLYERIWPNPDAMRERYGSDDPVWKFMLKRFWVGIKRLFS